MSGFGHYGLFDDELQARITHIQKAMDKAKCYIGLTDKKMHCRGCRESEAVKLPISFSGLQKRMKEFKLKHKDC